MKKFVYLLMFLLVSSLTTSLAQSNLSFDFGSDLVSRYIWRGVEFGSTATSPATPHIQPYASLTYQTGSTSFSLGAWASYGLDSEYSENDLYLNFSNTSEVGTISLTLSDYYYPYYGIDFSDFENDGLGAHTLEFNLNYTLAGSFPLTMIVSKNIHNEIPDEETLYFEVSYPVTISDVAISLFAGAAKGRSSWHGVTTDNIEFINVGFSASKSIKISESYSLPVGMSWILNPHQNKTYFVLKISI